MDHSGVVRCAGGLRIAQRHVDDASDADLVVTPVAHVPVPAHRGVESQRKDGVVWRRHWSDGRRLVIELVDIATIGVDRHARTITFDRHLDDELEQHLLLDHVLPLILASDGLLVLHGGVISRDEDGVVLVGATGAGKSTLTAFAWREGWSVGGDDGAVLHLGDPPRAEPTYPTVRLTPAAASLVGVDPAGCSPIVGKLRLVPDRHAPFRIDAVDLRAIIVIEPAARSTTATFVPMGGTEAHARLFAAAFHADFSGGARLPGVVAGLATVVDRVQVGRLHIPRGRDGLLGAERLLTDLVARSREGAAGRQPAVRLGDAS